MTTPPPNRVTARVLPSETPIPDTSTRRRRTGARVRRATATVLMGLLGTLLVFVGFGGSMQTASAGPIDSMKKAMCSYTEEAPAARTNLSEDSLFGKTGAPKDATSITAYEAFGTTGLYWSNFEIEIDGCVGNMFVGMLANQAFSFSTTVTRLTISTYSWATDGDLLDSFTDPLDCVIAGCEGSKGLADTLFLTYLLPVIVLGAVWAAWNGLFKKRTMHTTQGIVWMLGATTFAMIFLAQPGLIADKSNAVVSDISQTITNGVTGISAGTVGAKDPCYLRPSEDDRGNRIAKCSMWKAMVYTPWVSGQYGTTTVKALPGATATIGDRNPDKNGIDDLRLAQVDAQTLSNDEDPGDEASEWEAIKEKVTDEDSGIDAELWKGNNNDHRLAVGMASVAAALFLGILVILISFSTVVLSVGMILLIMMAPVFLLVGVHPGFGRGIALKWLELLLGTMFKRIVLTAVLAILVGMYQVILATPMPWLSQIALIIAMGMGAIVFRKPLLETLNVIQLGGSSTGMESGLARESKQAMGGAMGALGGGFAAAKVGGLGAVLPGAVKGGISGSRSGSPLRAASVGMGAGRRVGNREQAADNKREREQEQAENGGTDAQPGQRKAAPRAGTGPKNTAERDREEQDRAQDDLWRATTPSLDDILPPVDVPGDPGATRTPRVVGPVLSDDDTATIPVVPDTGSTAPGTTVPGTTPRPQSPNAPSGPGAPSVGVTPDGVPTAPGVVPAVPTLPGSTSGGVPTAPPAATTPRPAGMPTAPTAGVSPVPAGVPQHPVQTPQAAQASVPAPVGAPRHTAPAQTAPPVQQAAAPSPSDQQRLAHLESMIRQTQEEIQFNETHGNKTSEAAALTQDARNAVSDWQAEASRLKGSGTTGTPRPGTR